MLVLSYINYAAIKLIQRGKEENQCFYQSPKKERTPSEETKALKFSPYNWCLFEQTKKMMSDS